MASPQRAVVGLVEVRCSHAVGWLEVEVESGIAHAGSILVLADLTMPWPVTTFDEVTVESFAPVLARGDISILLLGCGRRMAQVPAELRRALRASGIVLDAMDTGAACRTYNILLAEERRVAAALIKLG